MNNPLTLQLYKVSLDSPKTLSSTNDRLPEHTSQKGKSQTSRFREASKLKLPQVSAFNSEISTKSISTHRPTASLNFDIGSILRTRRFQDETVSSSRVNTEFRLFTDTNTERTGKDSPEVQFKKPVVRKVKKFSAKTSVKSTDFKSPNENAKKITNYLNYLQQTDCSEIEQRLRDNEILPAKSRKWHSKSSKEKKPLSTRSIEDRTSSLKASNNHLHLSNSDEGNLIEENANLPSQISFSSKLQQSKNITSSSPSIANISSKNTKFKRQDSHKQTVAMPDQRISRARMLTFNKHMALERELFHIAEKLSQNYKLFYDNSLKYKSSEDNFRKILGNDKIVRTLFESKLKGKYKDPPSASHIIQEVKGVSNSNKPKFLFPHTESLMRASVLVRPTVTTNFDQSTIDALKKFNLRLEYFITEFKLSGIKGLEEQLFKFQDDMQAKEKEIFPKIAKFSQKRFSDLRIIYADSKEALITNGDYNSSDKLDIFENHNGGLEVVGQKNRIVNKVLDKLYLKWQILSYNNSNRTHIIGF